MREIFSKFKIEIIKDSIKRVQMDDATYFGSEYKDYISNSKLGLINPAQGGSPQKFLEGFKMSGNSPSLMLGSAVHQLTLEKNDYVLSNLTKPSGKLGMLTDSFIEELTNNNLFDCFNICKDLNNDEQYNKFIEIIEQNNNIANCLSKAIIKSDYYVNEISKYKGNGLSSRVKSGILKFYKYVLADKPKSIDNKSIIYLPEDIYIKCNSCINSLKNNINIQNCLNKENSYCEDVILCDVKVSFPENFNDEFSEMNEVILKIKIKIDNWTIDHDSKLLVLNDLKTSGKAIQYFMGYNERNIGFMGSEEFVFKKGSWQLFSYHRQMGEITCPFK